VCSYGNNYDYVWNQLVRFEGKSVDLSLGSLHSKYGITKETLKSYNKNWTLDSLTEQQAKTIAYERYYKANLIHLIIDDRVAMATLDWLYNSNPTNATKQIQKALGLKVTGKFSLNDISHINSMTWGKFISLYYPQRKAYFISLNKPKFIRGWLARLEKVRNL
jgi:lysozyme family protein